jgi:spermidine synthase
MTPGAEPWTELAHAPMPDGGELTLRRCGDIFEIRCNGWELMSNRAHRSEEAMARLACAGLAGAPRVLIGGLGMGFSLCAALDALPGSAHVIVAELVPDIIEWNRGPLAMLAGRPLDDARVHVRCGDVTDLLAGTDGGFDAILLDLDNGPAASIYRRAPRVYQRNGLALARRSLAPGGVLAVWSADRSEPFESALAACGFAWRGVEVSVRGDDDGPWHTIYLAQRVAETPGVGTALVV